MKLATYQDGSRDGQLVVVSRDLGQAHYASGIAQTVQQVLDDWDYLAPQLHALYQQLNAGRARHAFAFDPQQCLAPLPRAYHWVQAQAYPSHLARLALELAAHPGGPANAPEPTSQPSQPHAPSFPTTQPWMWQGAGHGFLGPRARFVLTQPGAEVDCGAGLAAVLGDVPQGASPAQALGAVRLLMLAASVHLRQVQRLERAHGSAPYHSNPAVAFSPVAVTPDELGTAWQQGQVQAVLQTRCNGRKTGLCETGGADMAWGFDTLASQLARSRPLGAGTVLGTGVVSNQDVSKGYASIAERRGIERALHGKAKTGYLREGDVVGIDLKGRDGQSLCGAIEMEIAALHADGHDAAAHGDSPPA